MSIALKPAITLVPNITEAVTEYARLRDEEKQIAAAKAKLANVIRVALSAEPGSRAVIAGWECKVTETAGYEKFDLKSALEKLDRRTLRPFISEVAGSPRLTVEPVKP